MLGQGLLSQFSCSGCGECCRWGGSVLLNDADIRMIAAYLGMTEPEFIESHTRLAPGRKQLALLDQKDGSCAFLKGDRCSIYDARPEQCRTFPFAWHVNEGCPELDRLLEEEKNIEPGRDNP
ncbi:MAG TPA: YkgJ family cysteine cluster protein [Pontiella sp.]